MLEQRYAAFSIVISIIISIIIKPPADWISYGKTVPITKACFFNNPSVYLRCAMHRKTTGCRNTDAGILTSVKSAEGWRSVSPGECVLSEAELRVYEEERIRALIWTERKSFHSPPCCLSTCTYIYAHLNSNKKGVKKPLSSRYCCQSLYATLDYAGIIVKEGLQRCSSQLERQD